MVPTPMIYMQSGSLQHVGRAQVQIHSVVLIDEISSHVCIKFDVHHFSLYIICNKFCCHKLLKKELLEARPDTAYGTRRQLVTS